MGRPAHQPLAPFFRSDTQAALLQRLIAAAERWTPQTDLMDIEASHQAIRDELRRLIEAGIVEHDRASRPHKVRFARDSPLAEPLQLLVERTVGVEPRLRAGLEAIGGVVAASVIGSWAARSVTPDSDVDVLVLVDDSFDHEALYVLGEQVEAACGRAIDWTIFGVEEARSRHASGSGFLRGIIAGPRIDLLGDAAATIGASAA